MINLVIKTHSDQRQTRTRGWGKYNNNNNNNYGNDINDDDNNNNLCLSQYECLQSFITKNENGINNNDDTYTICFWWDSNPQCDIKDFEISYNNNKINKWFSGYDNKICQIIKCDEQIMLNIGNDRLSCSNSPSFSGDNININGIDASCIGIHQCNDCQWTLFAPKCIVDTKICDAGLLIKNATFSLDLSEECKNTEENENECGAFQQAIATFEQALDSVNTSPKIQLSSRLSSEADIFINLEYDICYNKNDIYMVILYDVSVTKSISECIKQQQQIADTVQALTINNDIIIEYIEFDINLPNYQFILRSDDREIDDISFYQTIINRQRLLCNQDRRRPIINTNISQASDTFGDILGTSVLKLLSQSSNTQKKLLIFNDYGLDGRGEDDICNEYSPHFDLTGPIPPPTPPPVGGGGETPSPLPEPPAYVDFNGNYRIIIDWTLSNYDPVALDEVSPVVSLPTDILIDSGVPIYDGEFIFPTQFCGLRIKKADRFIWFINNIAQTDPIFDFPFNYIPEDESVNSIFGTNAYLGGIQFTGPIGKCREENNPWVFGSPWLQGDISPPDQSFSGLKLVIEVYPGSTIEFIDSNNEIELLDAAELWEEEEIEDICEVVPEFCEVSLV